MLDPSPGSGPRRGFPPSHFPLCSNDQINEKICVLSKAIDNGGSEEELTQLYIERGHCHEQLGDAASSVEDFLGALDRARLNSDLVHIKSMIALALAKKGQKEQALYWAMSAVDQDPGIAEGHHTLGLICDTCGFLNSAIETLQIAIQLEPQRWESVRLLGSCLRESGRVAEAIEKLSKYVEINPNEPLGLSELAWSLLAAHGIPNNLRMAEEFYEKALNNEPSPELRAIIERRLRGLRSQ